MGWALGFGGLIEALFDKLPSARRDKRRRKIERLYAELQNFRRILVRYEYHDANDLGFVHLGCILILLRAYCF